MTKAKELSELASATTVTSGNVALSGGLDVDGVTNLDVIDVDGAANFAADVTIASGADLLTASSGVANVLVGPDTGASITSGGNNNVMLGDSAGKFATTAVGSVFLGAGAGLGITGTKLTGNANIAIGINSGSKLQGAATLNVLVGDQSGTAVTVGTGNVAMGYKSLFTETGGQESVAIGTQALRDQSFSSGARPGNIGIGLNAGLKITSGINNCIMGTFAGDALTDADDNIAIGTTALSVDRKGSRSVAIGSGTLQAQNYANSGTTNNIAIGYNAGFNVISSEDNTFVGVNSGAGTVSGSYNTAMGKHALKGQCTHENTAVGNQALEKATAASNTAIGSLAGFNLTGGNGCVFLGRHAGFTGSPGGNVTTANFILVVGDDNITNAHTQVDWTIASDQRDKTDFSPLDLGLDFVKALAPVTYKWDKRSKYGDKTADGYDLDAQTPDGTHKEDWLDIGFKAQEVEALEQAAGYNKSNKTNLVSSFTEDGKQMGLQYSKFVPILVKAMQEQNDLIVALTARVATLEG